MTLTTAGVAWAAPSVSSLTVLRENPTTGDISIEIANPGTGENTVYIRFKPKDDDNIDWVMRPVHAAGSPVHHGLSGLAQGTEYEVQASLDASDWTGAASQTFDTLPVGFSFTGTGAGGLVAFAGETYVLMSFTVVPWGADIWQENYDGGIRKNLYVRYYANPRPSPVEYLDSLVFSTTARKPGFSLDRGTLTPGTGYHFEVSLDSDFNDSFTTRIGIRTKGIPRVSSVTATDVTRNSAKINVGLAGVKTSGSPDTDLDNTVYWRYRVVEEDWVNPDPRFVMMDDNGGQFDLTGLTENTTYEVEASLSSSFDPAESAISEPFMTTAPGLMVNVVDIGQIQATVNMTVTDPDDVYERVYLHYRTYTVETDGTKTYGNWSDVETITVAAGPLTGQDTASLTLEGLLSYTNYEVQASLQRSLLTADGLPLPADSQTSPVLLDDAAFTTLPPRITALRVLETGQTTARLEATIDHPNQRPLAMHVQYRVVKEGGSFGDWSTADQAATTTTEIATHTLEHLQAQTEYEVRAWVDVERDADDRVKTRFTTGDVTVEDVRATQVTHNSAVLEVDVVPHGGSALTVHLQYQADGETSWTTTSCDTTTADPNGCSVTLGSLAASTRYEVEASLDDAFPVDPPLPAVPETRRTDFTTQSGPPPDMQITSSTEQESATVTVAFANADSMEKTVHLQYRKVAAYSLDQNGNQVKTRVVGEWQKPAAQPTSGTSVEFSLTGLTSWTDYEVRASFEDDIDPYKEGDFTTLRPSISRVTIRDKTSIEATVNVFIQAPNEQDQRVYLQYREYAQRGQPWPTDLEDINTFSSPGETAEYLMQQLRKDTKYVVRLSLFPDFPSDARTWLIVFTTSAIVLEVGDLTQTTAKIMTTIKQESDAAKTVYLAYAPTEESDNPDLWATAMLLPDADQLQGSRDARSDQGDSSTTKEQEQEVPETREVVLDSLRAGTEYTVEASFNPFENTQRVIYIETFTTRPVPNRVNPPNPGSTGGGGGGGSGGGPGSGDDLGAPPLRDPYSDVLETNSHYDAIHALANDLIFVGTDCRPGEFCPESPIPRWVMAVWLVRMVDGREPAPVTGSSFNDVNPGMWWAAHVERLLELGITIGCWDLPDDFRYCPDDPTTRAQMASFLVRTFDFMPAASAGFVDTGDTVHRFDIDSIFAVRVTRGCAVDPLRYCPQEPTSRAQMASFLFRAREVV